jgi:hypothetical protein
LDVFDIAVIEFPLVRRTDQGNLDILPSQLRIDHTRACARSKRKEHFNDATQNKNTGAGGYARETRRVKELLGFVDGQTTNPSLIAKNPHIKELIASRHRLSNREEMEEYKKIVQTISHLVGEAGSFYRSILR